jgi:hypothetical protein
MKCIHHRPVVTNEQMLGGQKFSRSMKKQLDRIPTENMHPLEGWDWPGNIRELGNFVERLIMLTEGSVLCAPLDELIGPLHARWYDSDPGRDHIVHALGETAGVFGGWMEQWSAWYQADYATVHNSECTHYERGVCEVIETLPKGHRDSTYSPSALPPVRGIANNHSHRCSRRVHIPHYLLTQTAVWH